MKFLPILNWVVTFCAAAVLALAAIALDITRPRRYEFFAACCFGLAVCFVVLPAPAWAADGTTVSLPIGDWIDAIARPAIDVLTAALITVATWAMAKAPAPIAALIKTALTEQLFSRASTYAINAVAGAAHGEVLSVNVGNAVVAKMTQYFVDHAPSWLVVWLGGKDKIAEMAIARLKFDKTASVDSLDRSTVVSG